MNPQVIRELLKAAPFVPFRVHLSNGQTLDVMHPELAFVSRFTLFVGQGMMDPTRNIPDEFNMYSLLHVVRAEPLTTAARN